MVRDMVRILERYGYDVFWMYFKIKYVKIRMYF